MENNNEWAERLRRARLRAGMSSRRELADAAGLSKGTIDEWEQGHRLPRGESWLALQRALPDAPSPFTVTATSTPTGDASGFAVHLPMDPARRAIVLAELLAAALREQQSTGRDEY